VFEFLIEALIAVPVLLLWLTIVSILVRPFGVRLPLGPFTFAKHRSAFRALTFTQYLMICGVLYCGCGMLVVTTLTRYLGWRYWHGPALTSDTLIRDVLQYPLLSGVLFGLVFYFTTSGTNK